MFLCLFILILFLVTAPTVEALQISSRIRAWKAAINTSKYLSAPFLLRGGHLSLQEAISSPVAVALHSGRFSDFRNKCYYCQGILEMESCR
jgi:hypothetical protein